VIRYKRGIKVSGLIYFHQISNLKVEGTPLRNWRAFEGICGQHFNKVVLATTMWGSVDDEVGGKRELDLQDFWRVNIARGWSMQRFLRDRPSAADVLAPILEHPKTQPLQLQREISDFRLSLKQTTVARALFLQLEALLRDFEQEHEKHLLALTNPLIDKQQLRDLEQKINSSSIFVQRVKASLHDLKETSGEHFQRSILLTPGLGAIVRLVCLCRYGLFANSMTDHELLDFDCRSLCLPKRPELDSTNFDGIVLVPRDDENGAHSG
jgi:hypothetical protein